MHAAGTVKKQELVRSIFRGIYSDVDGYRMLSQMLKKQRDLMQRRDSNALQQHNKAQMELCEKLSNSSNARYLNLKALGVAPDSNGMETIIGKLPESKRVEVLSKWRSLLSTAKESQVFNEQNGKILVEQQEVIKSLLGQPKPDSYGSL